MKKNLHYFKLKKLAAGVLTAALSVSVLSGSALASNYAAPEDPIAEDEFDSTVVSGSTAAANTVALSLLGIDVTSTNGAGIYNSAGSTGSYGTDSANLGIFGSDLNDNPDPYIYNFFYNLYTTQSGGGNYNQTDYALWTKGTPYTLLWESNKSGPTGQASGTVTISIGDYGEETTNPAFYYEPDILLGGSGTQDSNGYTSLLEDYQEDHEDYDPVIFLGYGTSSGMYAASGTRSDGLGLEYNQFDMCTGLVYLGSVVQNLMNETDETTRYDQSPYEIAVNYDKYDRGLYYYVLSLFEKTTTDDEGNTTSALTKVNYAYGVEYDETNGYFITKGSDRAAQYASGIATDIYDLLAAGETISGETIPATTIEKTDSRGNTSYVTGYYLTETQLNTILSAPTSTNANATGVIINSDITITSSMTAKGIRALNDLPECVYGMTMQTVENGMGIPFYIGFMYYPQDSNLNPVNYIYYWIENFYHVSDTDDMYTIAQNMLVDADLPESLTVTSTSSSGYSASTIETQILAGIYYYKNTLVDEYDDMVDAGEIASDSAYYWSTLDEDAGIGGTYRDINASSEEYTCVTAGIVTEDDGFDNTIYYFSFESVDEE
ncbi:MAG: hypothetical protein LUG54_03720 [Clostridiales bacterium]|nr:hypothetical protein [Clostridiales bacterium]